ncbi:alpha/beta fold hydrolase [Nocardia sp. NPDC058633]|uniref:alpha/beta fold hydrolase n=1 Tax=Nocardia sp. NPDC058633 TaxID=3346568 RepID=UPI003646CD8F
MSTSNTPLLLLHGVTMSARAWAEVVPLLAPHHEIISPTALGHRDGPPAVERPTRCAHLVDNVERDLDARGLHQVHIAGNSLGGWMAIELARRGRAVTVCALSPAGFWDSGSASHSASTGRIAHALTLAKLGRPVTPLALRSPLVRRIILRDIAVRGDRATHAAALDISRDLLECTVTADLLGTDEQIAPLDPLPCPITLAWSEHDRILPAQIYGTVAQQRLPDAHYRILPSVGHVPMVDNPRLVAETILETTGASIGR